MNNIVAVSTPTGGYVEGNSAYESKWKRKINSVPLPAFGSISMGDASSPEPNFRAVEAFMALVCLANTNPFTQVNTFICAGSTFAENGNLWGLNPQKGKFWMDFYTITGIMERIPSEYAPIGQGIYKAIKLRKKTIVDTWNAVAPYMHKRKVAINWAFQVNVFEDLYKTVLMSELEKAVALDGIIVKFACPSCTYQHKKTVYHAVRRTTRGAIVTKDVRSTSAANCKGAKAWNDAWRTLTVHTAGIELGGRLSGKSVFYLTSLQKSNLIMRDYSDPRGTVAATIKNWEQNIWLSSRTYMPDEFTGFDLNKIVATNPQKWAKRIEDHPIFADGHAHYVKMP